MEAFKINEESALAILESQEVEKYFPKGSFDVLTRENRIALRYFLDRVSEKSGIKFSERTKVEAFGNEKNGMNIFCSRKDCGAT